MAGASSSCATSLLSSCALESSPSLGELLPSSEAASPTEVLTLPSTPAESSGPGGVISSLELEPGDAPMVRDLLLQHFRDPELEVEGKLGRRAKDRFNSGISAEQFAVLEARLDGEAGPAGEVLKLTPATPSKGWESTLDRFYTQSTESTASPATAANCDTGACGDAGGDCDLGGGATSSGRRPSRRGKRRQFKPAVRASFAFDETGRPLSSPFEVLRKTRLSDCHVAACCEASFSSDPIAPVTTPDVTGMPTGGAPDPALLSPVDLRVSFSREEVLPQERLDAMLLGVESQYERKKRRRIWEAPSWQVMLTHVLAKPHEAYEVEVELRMDVVRSRLVSSQRPEDDALLITREFVAVLRCLASWAAGVQPAQSLRKRMRLEAAAAAEPMLRAAAEESSVAAELRRRVQEGGRSASSDAAGGDGVAASGALHGAKQYLQEVLQKMLPAIDEATIVRFAGQQVARTVMRLR